MIEANDISNNYGGTLKNSAFTLGKFAERCHHFGIFSMEAMDYPLKEDISNKDIATAIGIIAGHLQYLTEVIIRANLGCPLKPTEEEIETLDKRREERRRKNETT